MAIKAKWIDQTLIIKGKSIGKMNGIREGGTNMYNYKYFDNVKKNGYFTESPCQFCGTTKNCLDGVFFESSDDISSICLECFDK